MNWSSLFPKDITQYPDKGLMRAVPHLKPEERPTVPVRMYDDPEKLYQETLQPMGGARLSSGAVAMVPRDKSAIYVRGGTMEHKDPFLLASKLAHEQVHVQQSNEERSELPAYEREAEVIARDPKRVSEGYRQSMNAYIEQLRRQKK